MMRDLTSAASYSRTLTQALKIIGGLQFSTREVNPLCRAEHRRVWADQPDRGDAWMRRVACRGWEAPSGNPAQTLRSAGLKRHRGGLFFGYFLLAKQKKVSRPSGRDPTLKQIRRDSDTKLKNILSTPQTYPKHSHPPTPDAPGEYRHPANRPNRRRKSPRRRLMPQCRGPGRLGYLIPRA